MAILQKETSRQRSGKGATLLFFVEKKNVQIFCIANWALFYIIITFLHKLLIKLVLNESRPTRYDDERDDINVPSTFISVEIQADLI